MLGTLPSHYPSDYPEAGLQLELADSTTVAELVGVLGIPPERVGIVAINGMLARAGDRIPENGLVKLMQGLAGG